MVVKLNDKSYDVAKGTTLDKFIGTLDVPLQGIAIAIDYEVIPRSQWDEILLKDNMELMLIHAVSGG
ncbi:MAG: sulfur carrier protein ThiS [Tannerella sp.]|jgi:sulfur carrier protein|nr:sulfur carrier protein ThiS [Tannerella sp.]